MSCTMYFIIHHIAIALSRRADNQCFHAVLNNFSYAMYMLCCAMIIYHGVIGDRCYLSERQAVGSDCERKVVDRPYHILWQKAEAKPIILRFSLW